VVEGWGVVRICGGEENTLLPEMMGATRGVRVCAAYTLPSSAARLMLERAEGGEEEVPKWVLPHN
jgi:hypothetical protein